LASADGVRWSAPRHIYANSLNRVLWTGSRWVAVGGDLARLVFTSEDGASWTRRLSVTGGGLNDLAWDGLRLVAVGEDGAGWTRAPGPAWTGRKVAPPRTRF